MCRPAIPAPNGFSTSHPISARCVRSWRVGSCGLGAAASPRSTRGLGSAERVRYPRLPTSAVMRTPKRRRTHDATIEDAGAAARDNGTGVPHHPAGAGAAAARGLADRDHGGAEAAVARTVRQGAAALQPTLSGQPARLPDPGTRLWRAEAGDAGSARGAGRAARRRQRGVAPHPCGQPTTPRYAAAARVAGRRACGDRAAG